MTGGNAPPAVPAHAATVSNSSPIIALSQIRRLDLLKELLGSVLIAPAVAAEVAPEFPTLPPWLIETPLTQVRPPAVAAAALGPGESESIALATERNARVLVLDDRAARLIANRLHIPIVGTLGLLLAGKRRGVVPSVTACLDELDAVHFHVSPRLRE